MESVTSSFRDPSGFIFRYENNIWFYLEMTGTSLRVDHPSLEVKNKKKTIYTRI